MSYAIAVLTKQRMTFEAWVSRIQLTHRIQTRMEQRDHCTMRLPGVSGWADAYWIRNENSLQSYPRWDEIIELHDPPILERYNRPWPDNLVFERWGGDLKGSTMDEEEGPQLPLFRSAEPEAVPTVPFLLSREYQQLSDETRRANDRQRRRDEQRTRLEREVLREAAERERAVEEELRAALPRYTASTGPAREIERFGEAERAARGQTDIAPPEDSTTDDAVLARRVTRWVEDRTIRNGETLTARIEGLFLG